MQWLHANSRGHWVSHTHCLEGHADMLRPVWRSWTRVEVVDLLRGPGPVWRSWTSVKVLEQLHSGSQCADVGQSVS